jgi:hypothetical protein
MIASTAWVVDYFVALTHFELGLKASQAFSLRTATLAVNFPDYRRAERASYVLDEPQSMSP